VHINDVAAPAPTRVASVDFLRGVAIVGVALVHSILYLTPVESDVDPIYVVFEYVLGNVGAALFVTLVGVSFVLSMRSRSGMANRTIVIGATIRGLFLVVVGILVSLVTTGPATVMEWDVLALIGISSIVLALVRNAPTWLLILLAGALWLAAPVVRATVGYLEWWGKSMKPVAGFLVDGTLMVPAADYHPGIGVLTGLSGLLTSGWFPILPWLAFPVLGIVLGRQITGDRRVGMWWLGVGGVLFAGSLAVALASASLGPSDPVAGYFTVLAFTPNSTSMLTLQLGLVLIVMGATHLTLDGPRMIGRWMDPIRLFSRYALTVYVASYVVLYLPIHLADVFDRSRAHVYALTTTGWALLFGVAFTFVTYAILRVWDRNGGVGSIEWLLNHLRIRAGVKHRAAPTG
jgi:uncharacterized membrane protein